MWKRAWVDGFDSQQRLSGVDFWPESYRLIQNEGRGLLMQGARDWTDYQVSARLTPHMCQAGGVAVRVQGMRRYYAMLIDQEKVRLVRALDGDTVLAEADFGWEFGLPYDLNLQVTGNKLTGTINGKTVIEAQDPEQALVGGGIALISEVGRIACDEVAVRPV
jgi:hypothetical protein